MRGLVLALALGACLACNKVKGPQKFAGYVYDVTTATALTGYTLEVETADGKRTVEGDGTGRFEFSMDVGSDYIIRITRDGYRNFTSSNLREQESTQHNEINENLRRLFIAPLVPNTVSHPEIAARVFEERTGKAVGTGFFRVTATGMATGFQNQLYRQGGNSSAPRYWLPDAQTLAGPMGAAGFTIPQGFFLPGFTYDVVVFGATGFRDRVTTVTYGTGALNTLTQLNIPLLRLSATGNPPNVTLLGQSHLGPNGFTPVPLTTDRAIVFTFDRDVQLFKDGLKNQGSNALLTVVTADSNGNGITTPTTLNVENVATGGFSSNVAVTSQGNTVTVTLAADATLINTTGGPIDTGDDLAYTFTATLLNNIQVRDAANGYDVWQTLNSFSIVNNIVIRGAYP